MKKIFNLAVILGFITTQFFCHKLPDQVWIKKPSLFPEGLEYFHKNYYVTSLREGMVGKVDQKGNYTVFINDDDLISAIGIRIDKKRNRLYVANSDPGVSKKTNPSTQKKLAGLGVYDLETGKRIQYYVLSSLLQGGNHFANDIALDKETGDVYVTDSFSPVIYKVPLEGKPSVFLESPKFKGEGFNLNGIVVYKDYLIVAKDNDGKLFRIPLKNPQNFSQIKTKALPGADGLILDHENHLIVNANGDDNSVYLLSSGDNFESAKVEKKDEGHWRFNTTGFEHCKNFYTLNAELNKLFSGNMNVEQFEIRKVVF